jgi:hypothetical protein
VGKSSQTWCLHTCIATRHRKRISSEFGLKPDRSKKSDAEKNDPNLDSVNARIASNELDTLVR